jgi:hypothetical protein
MVIHNTGDLPSEAELEDVNGADVEEVLLSNFHKNF